VPQQTSSPSPDKVAAHTEASAQSRAPRLVDRPLGHGTLGPDPRHDPVEVRLYDHATDNHLGQGGVQALKVEDEVQLAHVLEQLVQRLDVDLDEVDQGEGRLGGRRDDDEEERRVVPVRNQRGDVVVLLVARGVGGPRGGEEGREGEEVAGAGWPVGDEGEDFGNEALLYAGVLWDCQCGSGTSSMSLKGGRGGPELTSCV
jgi:hypothetical protein